MVKWNLSIPWHLYNYSTVNKTIEDWVLWWLFSHATPKFHKKRQYCKKGNFTHEKFLKCLNVSCSKTIKKARNTRGHFSFRSKNLLHSCNIIYFRRLLSWIISLRKQYMVVFLSQMHFTCENKHTYLPWPLRNLCFTWFALYIDFFPAIRSISHRLVRLLELYSRQEQEAPWA